MMMAVSFERYGRLYYLDPGAHKPAIGDKVLVPTDSGPEVAECVWAPQWVPDEIEGLPVPHGIHWFWWLIALLIIATFVFMWLR